MMNTENSNLEFLKKSKKQLHPGDIFVLKPRGRDYYFGRVINTFIFIMQPQKIKARFLT